MKIRTNYVSNSSSSSFCIIGNLVKEPISSLKNGKKVWVYVEHGGTSGENEDWAMELNYETYDILNRSKWIQNKNPLYIESVENVSCDWDKKCFDNNLNITKSVKGNIFAFNIDDSSPCNKEDLIRFLEFAERWM